MTVEQTLATADADLRAGRVPMARQRLRGLVCSYPTDLRVRRRLGEIYRLYGEPTEAGRWLYLDDDRDPEETAAFEARHHTPAACMVALAWRGPESAAATPFARARLAELREAATADAGHPVDWDDLRPDSREHDGGASSPVLRFLGCGTAVVTVLFLLLLVILGAISLVRML
ncbi:DUF6584 family protein [Kitasatospora paranensis]|uniref:DUF6584 family protein n=1 Tax=Kitasatospora paranensis TaxID=258053 RepID=A0ABW2G1X4_9ACTN